MPSFLLPDLGEGLEEAEVVAWRVAPGDRVEVDQVVAEVETAKAVVEVPVPFAGVVDTLHARPGTRVAVGSPLITVGDASAATDDRGGDDAGSGNVLIGYGTSEPSRARRRASRVRHRDPQPAAGPAAAPAPEPTSEPAPAPASRPATGSVPVISPIVRGLARRGGLDLTTITGTGAAGVVRRRDVEQALAALTVPAHTVPAHTAPAHTAPTPSPSSLPPTPSTSGTTGVQRRPLSGPQKAAAVRLARSRREIPDATVWVDVDATDLLAARAAIGAAASGRPVSVLALLARFTVLAARRFPELNATLDGDTIVVPDHVHLGVAAQTERGLLVPVVRHAERLSTRQLSDALAAQIGAARDGSLPPAALTGSTITVNNYGVFGVDGSAAIINHPEVAIVGMGRIMDRPWVVDGTLAVRKITQLTLSFDHRVCDGGTAGGFLRYLADCLEQPVTALGDL